MALSSFFPPPNEFGFAARNKKAGPRHPPLQLRPQGVRRRSLPAGRLPSRPRWSLPRNCSRRYNMATIGSFKKVGNEFQGELVTLSVQTKGVRIVQETSRGADNAPSHRVYVGRA